MSVVVVATITPAEGQFEAVKQLFVETIPKVHAEPGCELYALHEDDTDLVMIERWESQEALSVHSTAPALSELGPKLRDKLSGALNVKTYTAVPAGDAAKGAI